MDDSLLILNLIKGDHSTYAAVVKKYHHPLCVYATGLTHDADAAKDVVQEVLIRLWERKVEIPKSVVLKNYLYKAVYNEFVDQYRKGKKLTALEQFHHEELFTIATEEEEAYIKNLYAVVLKVVNSMDAIYKDTFKLSRFEGLTNAEIAKYQNISVKTVEVRIAKAFSMIKEHLTEKDFFLYLFLLRHYKNELMWQ